VKRVGAEGVPEGDFLARLATTGASWILGPSCPATEYG
jgi:hypothetical protein